MCVFSLCMMFRMCTFDPFVLNMAQEKDSIWSSSTSLKNTKICVHTVVICVVVNDAVYQMAVLSWCFCNVDKTHFVLHQRRVRTWWMFYMDVMMMLPYSSASSQLEACMNSMHPWFSSPIFQQTLPPCGAQLLEPSTSTIHFAQWQSHRTDYINKTPVEPKRRMKQVDACCLDWVSQICSLTEGGGCGCGCVRPRSLLQLEMGILRNLLG